MTVLVTGKLTNPTAIVLSLHPSLEQIQPRIDSLNIISVILVTKKTHPVDAVEEEHLASQEQIEFLLLFPPS